MTRISLTFCAATQLFTKVVVAIPFEIPIKDVWGYHFLSLFNSTVGTVSLFELAILRGS